MVCKLLNKGLPELGLRHSGTPPALLMENVGVCHSDVHKVVEKSAVPLPGPLKDTVIPDENIRQVKPSYVLVIVFD